MLASADWVAIASVSTALATLVLAFATFFAVRSANRTARAAEKSLAAQLWPLLAPARPEDPRQEVPFVDEHHLSVPGGRAVAEATADAVYFAMGVRNVGPGLAILDRWWFDDRRPRADTSHAEEDEFRRLTRDLYVPPGDVGFWQGAMRDPTDPGFAAATAAIAAHGDMTIDLLYTDHFGRQRTISRFVLRPDEDGMWSVGLTRHWNLDGPDPRAGP